MRVLPLALAAAIISGLCAILIYLSGLSSCNVPSYANPLARLSPLLFFLCFASRGEIPESERVVDADGGAGLSEADLAALAALQAGFSKCVVRHSPCR